MGIALGESRRLLDGRHFAVLAAGQHVIMGHLVLPLQGLLGTETRE
jgi:hypothetical protein